MNLGLEMIGDKQLRKNLNALQEKISDRIMLKGIRSGLVPIGREARRLARSQFKNNAIAKMISRKAARTKDKDKLYGKVYINDKKTEHAKITVYGELQSFAAAAGIQEYGTRDGRVPAKPYMRPAFDSQKNVAFERLADKARTELAKEVAKMKKR